MYSIGDPTAPAPDDERFGEIDRAIYVATQRSIDDHVWAVWDDETGEVLALVFAQEVYRP